MCNAQKTLEGHLLWAFYLIPMSLLHTFACVLFACMFMGLRVPEEIVLCPSTFLSGRQVTRVAATFAPYPCVQLRDSARPPKGWGLLLQY